MKLEKTVARYLISTPCRVVGEFSTDDVAIDHAWPHDPAQLTAQVHPGPFSRSYYVVSVTHEEHGENDGVAFPRYLINAELMAALASVWFGKRFDVHGPLEEHGRFMLPSLWATQPIADPAATPFSHEPRKDLDIALSWSTFDRPFELFKKYREGDSAIRAFWRATRFYARALRSFDNDPEVAFFHLIVAIEMLVAGIDFTEDQKFDAEILGILKRIREELRGGEHVERKVRGRLYQLRRRVSHCAVELTNDNFFDGSEAKHPAFRLRKGDLVKRVKAAYDLRSKYAHAGAAIGEWVKSLTVYNVEIQVGRPEMKDRKLAKLIQDALTLGGLERLVRFMTLRFAHLKISHVHDALE